MSATICCRETLHKLIVGQNNIKFQFHFDHYDVTTNSACDSLLAVAASGDLTGMSCSGYDYNQIRLVSCGGRGSRGVARLVSEVVLTGT
jgi:hypothetical protein